MSEDRCVICGAYVPEGRLVCPDCEKRPMKNLSHGEMVQIAEEKRKPMDDLISRHAAIDALEAKKDKSAKGDMGCFYNTIIQNDIDALRGLSSAQPERKKGKWEVCGTFDDFLKCSCCGYKKPWNEDVFDFCPKCGAEMEETDGKIC